jgi:hypothetical protein
MMIVPDIRSAFDVSPNSDNRFALPSAEKCQCAIRQRMLQKDCACNSVIVKPHRGPAAGDFSRRLIRRFA